MPLSIPKHEDDPSYGLLMAIEGRPATMKELRQRTGYSRSVLMDHLHRLQRAGLIVQRKDNRYVCIVVLMPIPMEQATKAQIIPKTQAPRVTDTEAPVNEGTASQRAAALAKRLKVPTFYEGRPLTLSKSRARCKCGNTTPLRYGENPVCPKCAREVA